MNRPVHRREPRPDNVGADGYSRSALHVAIAHAEAEKHKHEGYLLQVQLADGSRLTGDVESFGERFVYLKEPGEVGAFVSADYVVMAWVCWL